jgi:hypothetical protein
MSAAFYGVEALLAAGPGPASPLPEPNAVRRTADEVLSRPEFHLGPTPEAGEGIGALFIRLLGWTIGAILRLFHWLSDMSPVLAWLVIIGLCIVLLVILGHIIWTIVSLFRRDRRQPLGLDSGSRKKFEPAELARQAEAARAGGNYILGVRLLYLASLVRLAQVEGKPLRPSATNHEHLNRYRSSPLYEWLGRFVSVIDLKWYGSGTCVADDFASCHEAFGQICSLAVGAANAQRS